MDVSIDEYSDSFYNKFEESEYQINQGASVLLIKRDKIYFALAKEKSWKYDDGVPIIKFTGIGGTREKEEKIMDTLKRELYEEVEISIDRLCFPKINETLIVKNYEENSKIKFKNCNTPNPLYVVDYRLPLREDVKSYGKKYSCLQLFVYIAKVSEDCEIKPRENDNITGIISANKQQFNNYIDGNYKVNIRENNITWKNKYKDIEEIIVNPKFTPQGLKKAGLTLENLLKLF